MAAVKALQQWCRVQCEGYRDVSITNMTTSFRDGLAFCALIHKHRPELINFDSLKKEDVYDNNKLAFQVAEQELGIPALLDAEDMVALKVPDRLSILTYVSQYYNYFHGRSPIGGMGGIKRPAEGPADAPSGKKNQPVAAKAFPPSRPARENSPPPSSNVPRPSPAPRQARSATQDATLEKPHQSGTLSNRCVACNQHVHLVQRHLVDGKLYHRNCAKLQAPANSTSPLRPLPTNTPVSRWTPPPDSAKTITPSPSQAPSRPAPSPQTEKLGTPSTFSSAFSASPPSRPAAGFPSTTKEGRTALTSKPAAPHTTGGTTFTTTTYVTARPASATAEKTQQAKLKFLQLETTTNNEEKKTGVSEDVKKALKDTGKVQEARAGQAPAAAAGGAGRKQTNTSAGEKAKAAAGGNQADNETNKAKASAAAFISKKLAEENNNNKPSWANVALKKTDKAEAQAETPRRDAGVVKGRVKLKVDPSILADLQPVDTPAAGGDGGFRPGGASPAHWSSGSEAPADWRSKLKPVAKDAKPVGPSQPLKPWAVPTGPAQTPERRVPPASSSVLPVSKGLQNGQKDKTANGTKSNASKTKPDYIPREVMMRELQEIEDNLNELEKRGVELEMKLRKSEEEGKDDSLTDELMVEWFGLIRNKQVAMRRESELNYIGRTQELEEEQPSVEQELRRLMDKPDRLKTAWDRKKEEQLMKKLMEIVNDRNAIVEGLDEDRLREEEEDEQLNKMMMDFNIKKDKAKKKSPMAKLLGWGNKKEG